MPLSSMFLELSGLCKWCAHLSALPSVFSVRSEWWRDASKALPETCLPSISEGGGETVISLLGQQPELLISQQQMSEAVRTPFPRTAVTRMSSLL